MRASVSWRRSWRAWCWRPRRQQRNRAPTAESARRAGRRARRGGRRGAAQAARHVPPRGDLADIDRARRRRDGSAAGPHRRAAPALAIAGCARAAPPARKTIRRSPTPSPTTSSAALRPRSAGTAAMGTANVASRQRLCGAAEQTSTRRRRGMSRSDRPRRSSRSSTRASTTRIPIWRPTCGRRRRAFTVTVGGVLDHLSGGLARVQCHRAHLRPDGRPQPRHARRRHHRRARQQRRGRGRRQLGRAADGREVPRRQRQRHDRRRHQRASIS